MDSTRGELGTLVGHLARANPIWRALSADAPAVVVFQGADAYITPSWYAAKQEHGKVVPTWNYAVVHAHGTPRAIEDIEWLRRHVTELVDQHESPRTTPWRVSDAPAHYIDGLLRAIVGVEIPIDALVGKWKTSQNRSREDQRRVAAGLQEQGDSSAAQMASLVQRHVLPDSDEPERENQPSLPPT